MNANLEPPLDDTRGQTRAQTLAEQVFGDAARAQVWLQSPKERLGGATPMVFAADTQGCEAVQAWLHEIDQGYFA